VINFKLIDGDLVFDNQNNISMVSDDDELLQCIEEILKTNTGEWFLDDSVGFARFELLGSKFNEDTAIDLLTEAILQETRIDSLENLTLDFDRKTRKLSVTFEIIKATGESLIGEVVI
jgi:phage baseplate assembly protein W